MANAPLLDRPGTSSQISLESVVSYISAMTSDHVLEAHICEKVKKNWQTFPLPKGDEIMVLGRMLDGFVVGLKSGKLMVVMPPAVTYLQLHETPIIGLFAYSNYFIAVASSSQCKLWNPLTEAEESPLPATTISAVCGNMQKELLFLGLESGALLQFAIVDKEKCKLEKKGELAWGDETMPAYDVRTTDEGSWVAVKYRSGALGIWDHGNGVLLYYFTFAGTQGLPKKWPFGETTDLPRFCTPQPQWGVFQHCILLPPKLVLKFTGNNITSLKTWNRLTDPDDPLWEAMGESIANGHVPFQCDNSLITFTSGKVSKKKIADKHYPEVEINLGLDFFQAERSEANNYIAFACGTSLEVLCISAINYEFAHPFAGPVKFTKSQKCIFTRFNALWDRPEEPLLRVSLREKVLKVSPDGMWITVGTYKYSKLTGLHLHHIASEKRISLPAEWEQCDVLYAKFTKSSNSVGLLLSGGFLIIDLSSSGIVFEMKKEFKPELARLKLTISSHFLITVESECVFDIDIAKPGQYTEVPWKLSRLTFVDQNTTDAVIAYSSSQTVACSVGQYSGSAIEEGFERVKVVNSAQHCVGYNAAGTLLMNVSNLAKLVRIPVGYQVIASKSLAKLYAFNSDLNAKAYALVDVWDLEKGIKTGQTYSGLRYVLDNKLRVKGQGTWRQGKLKMLKRTDTSHAQINGTWVCDIESLTAPPQRVKEQKDTSTKGASILPQDITIIEEQFERHCLAWKKLAVMLKTGKMQEGLKDIVLRPMNMNILHLLVFEGSATGLAQALAQKCPIMTSCYGSPVTIALERKSRKCLNIILSDLIVLKGQDPSAFLSALSQINGDIPDLIQFGSPYLCEFFQQVMVPLPDEILVPVALKPRFDLPLLTLASDLWVRPPEVPTKDWKQKDAVEFLVCPFGVHLQLGTTESLNRMRFLVQGDIKIDLFGTEFIKTIVNQKWDWLWPFILLSTFLYWCFLLSLIAKMFRDFHYIDPYIIEYSFITLNSWFALVELFQAGLDLKDYVMDYWNYVDVTRIALSYVWIVTATDDENSQIPHQSQWLTFIVVLLSVLRGIKTFEAFDATRYYVRMVIVVTRATISFIWVFFYSTFAFGLLFSAVRPDLFPDFFSIWVVPYEMNMGSFNLENKGQWYWLVFMAAALLNVVIMLNLVVSVLGDAFSTYHSQSEAADIYGKAEVIYEHELMMWWRRGSSQEQFMHICREDSGEEPQDSQRLTAIKKMLKQAQTDYTTVHKSNSPSKYQLLQSKLEELTGQIAKLREQLGPHS